MKPPVLGWIATTAHQPVCIPTLTGDGTTETLWIDVPAWKDPISGQVFLDGHSREKLDAVKARYLGILTPHSLHKLRNAIGTSQKGMAELLQLGEKSWTRWETGKEKPSRSMNVLLCALYDGRLDVNYLQTLTDPSMRSQFKRWKPAVRFDAVQYTDHQKCEESYAANESATIAA